MNTGPIRIPALEDEDEMRDAFYKAAKQLQPAFDRFVRNPYAQVSDATITDVCIEGDTVSISYEYDWHVHMGCDNMNQFGEEDGFLVGRLVDGEWVFPRYVPPATRDTVEEF